MKWTKLISWNFSFEFSGFYYTSKFLRILRIFPQLKQLSYKTNLENLPFSRNLLTEERKRCGQGGVMWTEDYKRSDANHIAWINRIQISATHCVKLGRMRAQESYIDTFTAQSTAPCLFGAFPFAVWKDWRGEIHESTPQPRGKNTVKRNSKRRIPRMSSENRKLFYRSKFSRATGVSRQRMEKSHSDQPRTAGM